MIYKGFGWFYIFFGVCCFMSLGEILEQPMEDIDRMIRENISRESRGLVANLVYSYAGMDEKALGVLVHAAQQGRLDEFVGRLRQHYMKGLNDTNPIDRKARRGRIVQETEVFFAKCYGDLRNVCY